MFRSTAHRSTVANMSSPLRISICWFTVSSASGNEMPAYRKRHSSRSVSALSCAAASPLPMPSESIKTILLRPRGRSRWLSPLT